MKSIIFFMYLLLFLIIQIDQQYAIPVSISSSEDNQYEPLSWYKTINNFEDNHHQQHSIDRSYKRFINDFILPNRQRRFGNTKYGRRSLLTE